MTTTTIWQDKIAAINETGEWPYSRIADFCGCKASTVGDLALGRTREPKASTALALIDLHKQVARKLAREAKDRRKSRKPS